MKIPYERRVYESVEDTSHQEKSPSQPYRNKLLIHVTHFKYFVSIIH